MTYKNSLIFSTLKRLQVRIIVDLGLERKITFFFLRLGRFRRSEVRLKEVPLYIYISVLSDIVYTKYHADRINSFDVKA